MEAVPETSQLCDICGLRYATRFTLLRHKSLVHGDLCSDANIYRCQFCALFFMTNSNFQKHLRRKHPDAKEMSKDTQKESSIDEQKPQTTSSKDPQMESGIDDQNPQTTAAEGNTKPPSKKMKRIKPHKLQEIDVSRISMKNRQRKQHPLRRLRRTSNRMISKSKISRTPRVTHYSSSQTKKSPYQIAPS